MPKRKNNTILIKEQARKLGFDFCGISRAEHLKNEEPRLEQWLNQNMHGKMHYMADHFEKRLDPTKLVEGARSVISLMYNYFPEQELNTKDNYKISKYAYGKDYHFVIKNKLKSLFSFITEHIGEIRGRAFVDSAPVMERVWAQRSGIGWIGKNGLLLNRQSGSFFLLAELILDLELEADHPIKDYCGSCTRCMDACPTQAIVEPYLLDARKCISYLTIELKDKIPQKFEDKMDDWIFGCDICQDVCPWNRFSQPHKEPQFQPHHQLKEMKKSDWQEITQEVFNEMFRQSAVKRTKYQGLTKNIQFIAHSHQMKNEK